MLINGLRGHLAEFGVVDQLRLIEVEIEKLEERILAWHRAGDVSRRLATVPGFGPIITSAIAAVVPDGSVAVSLRHLPSDLEFATRRAGRGMRSWRAASALSGMAPDRRQGLGLRRPPPCNKTRAAVTPS